MLIKSEEKKMRKINIILTIVTVVIMTLVMANLSYATEYRTLKPGAIICETKKTAVLIEDVRNDENLLNQVWVRVKMSKEHGLIIRTTVPHKVVIQSQDGDKVEVTLRSIQGYYWTFKEFVE